MRQVWDWEKAAAAAASRQQAALCRVSQTIRRTLKQSTQMAAEGDRPQVRHLQVGEQADSRGQLLQILNQTLQGPSLHLRQRAPRRIHALSSLIVHL